MRKIFSLFAAILFAASMMADSYTITFKDGGTDSDKTSSLTSTTVSDYVDAGAEYVSAIAPTGKVYFAKTGAGLKFGNSSGGGSVTLTLATPIKPTSIVISASQFGASEGSGLFQEETFDMTGGGGKYAFNDYTVTYDGETEVATISVGTAKRGYVNSITVNYASQGGEEPVVEPETKTIYLNGGGSSLWNQADPEFFVHSWGGAADGDVHMTLVEGDVYKADIPADNTDLLFLRLATGTTEIVWSGDAHWNQSTDQTIPEGKDLFTMTSWDNGEWSVYSAQGGDDPEPVDPTPAEKDSIYFVNVAGWAAPRVHLWGGTAAGTEWPGVEMTKLDDQINNYDVYKYVADKGAYANCLFSDNGAEDKKTADLTWTSGKYFYNDAWYAQNEIPAPVELEDKLPVVAIAGTMNEWSAEANIMANATDSLSASVTIALEAQKYEFKVVSDGNWLSLNGEGETLYGIHREWNEVAHINGVDLRNFELTADVAGEYTFTWTYADSTLVVTFPEKPAEPVVGDGPIFEWTKGAGTAIAADNTDLNANDLGTMTVGKSVVARLLGTNAVENNAKGYKLGNNDVCVEIEGTRAFAAGDTVVITGVCGGSGERAFAVAPVTTIDAKADTVLTNYQENTSDVLEYKAVLKEQQAGDKIRIFRLAGKTMYLYSIKVLPYVEPVEPTPAEKDSIYFVNVAGWAAPRVHLWGGTAAGTEWPGVEMTKLDDKINNYDVYKYVADQGAYANCIFSDNGENQTADQTWTSGKYFYNDAWYALDEIPAGGEQEQEAFVGFDARTTNLGEQIAAGLAKNQVNVSFVEDLEGKYSISLVEGGVEGSFSFGGVVFAYKNSNPGTLAWKTTATYIQPNGKDREVRIPMNAGEKANVILTEAFEDVLVNGVSTNLAAGDNILTAAEGGLVLKTTGTSKPRIQAVLPVVVPVDSMTVYFVNETAWENVDAFVWPAEGEAYKAWPGEAMTKEAEQINGFDVYSYTFPASYVNIIFNNGNSGEGNQTDNLVWEEAKPYFYGGAWYASLEAIPAPEAPAKFYVTGDSALIADAAPAGTVAWASNAIKSENDTLVLNLKAGVDYQLSLTVDGTWNTKKTYANLTQEDKSGLYDVDGDNHNIGFKLNEAGEVKVVYFVKDEVVTFELIGNFYVDQTPVIEPEDTYTVAGNNTTLFGSSWDPTDTTNDMTLVEGIYKWEKSEVALAEGSVQFKVVKDHNWNYGSYPADNYQLAIPADGIYTVTITFDPANLTVDATALKTGDAEVEKHYLVVGQAMVANGEDWNNDADINLMTSADEGLTYTLEIADLQLIAGTLYRYKIVEKGSWVEYFPKHVDNSDTCFTVPQDGIYTITYVYTVATSLCEVQAQRTGDLPAARLTDGYYLVGNFSDVPAWSVDGLTDAQRFVEVESDEYGTYYSLTADLAVDDSIKVVKIVHDAIVLWMPEGTGNNVVIDANHAGEAKIIHLAVAVTGEWSYYVEPNIRDGFYLLGSLNNWTPSDEYRFGKDATCGENEFVLNTTLAENDEIKVAKVVNGVATTWYPEGEGNNYVVDAAHAGEKAIYFQETYKEDWATFGGYIWIDPNETTAISNTAADAEAVKVLHNGMLLIRKGNKTYNIMGQAVK